MKQMSQLLQRLSQRDNAAIFNHPVSALEYPDYHHIVASPMDLGTIQGKLQSGDYPTLEACAKDVRLVWTNAYLYNPEGSVVADAAQKLSKTFENMYNRINPTDFNYDREPVADERQKFSRDIYRVEDAHLAEALDMLTARCPQGLIRNKEEGYVVVKVDALPAPVFWEVELYLKSRLYNQPDRTKKKIPTTLRATPEYVTARLISPTMDERGGGGGGRSRGGSNLADSRGAGDSNDRKRSASGVSRNGVAIGGGHAESGGGGGAGEAGVFHGSKKEAGSRGRSGSGAGSISAASANATAAAVVKGNVDRKEASLKNAVARDGCTAVSGGGRHAEGSCSHGGSNSNGTSSKKNSKRNLIASSGHAVSGSGFSRNSHSSSSSSGHNSSSNSNSNSSRSSSSSAASEVPGSGVRNGVHKTHRHANHPQQHRPTVTAPGRGDPRLKGTLTKAGGLAEGRGGPGGGVQARRNDSSKRWRSSAEGISKNPGGVGMLSHRNNSGVIRSGAVEGWGALSRGGVGQGGGGNHETGWTRGPANQAYREGDPSHKRQRVHDSGV